MSAMSVSGSMASCRLITSVRAASSATKVASLAVVCKRHLSVHTLPPNMMYSRCVMGHFVRSSNISPIDRFWRKTQLCMADAPVCGASPVTCITPPPIVCLLLWRKTEGSPISLPSQSMTIVSSSVHAGLDAYTATTLHQPPRHHRTLLAVWRRLCRL